MLIYAKISEPIKFCHFLVSKYPKSNFLGCLEEKIQPAEECYGVSNTLVESQLYLIDVLVRCTGIALDCLEFLITLKIEKEEIDRPQRI